MAGTNLIPNWRDAAVDGRTLIDAGWFSPDSWSSYYEEITEVPAVYLFQAFNMDDPSKAVLAYVGMATNLKRRLSGHEVLAKIRAINLWPKRWFKPTDAEMLRDVERHYIEKFDPAWNLIGRRRGLVLS